MRVVYGAFPASAPRVSTAGTQPSLYDAMSQSPCPRGAVDRRSIRLGEQWIEEVTDVEIVQTPQEECLEGEHLKFEAHIRGWKTETRKERCQQPLDKSDYNLRQALLRPLWKDILLIPQAWYPEHKPKYETQGWRYAPSEEVLGRECKSCSVFYELAGFAGTKRRKESLGQCRKC